MRHRTNRRKTSKRMRGGDFTSGVFGGMNDQVAMVGRGNEISMNQNSMNIPTTEMKGGRKKGGGITELAVPAVLLYANQFLGSKDKSNRAFKSAKKFGGSRRHRRKKNTVRFRKSRR